ncbi:hypothetical protein PGB90_003943 [Kerria lacca]
MNPSVPTISVTPHSSSGIGVSTVNKQYSILEENLKQLHEIVEAVQHMKDSNFNTLSVSNQIVKIGEQCIRLSCSCPSLNELSSDTEAIGNSLTSSPSRVDLSLSKSTPYISVSSPSIHSKQREFEDWKSFDCRIINSLGGGEILRRRSWAALEDLSAQRETDLKIIKQRSISLSSLVSDVENISQKPYGTESETEEEILVSLLDNNCLQHFPYSDEIAQNTVFDAFLEEKSSTSTALCYSPWRRVASKLGVKIQPTLRDSFASVVKRLITSLHIPFNWPLLEESPISVIVKPPAVLSVDLNVLKVTRDYNQTFQIVLENLSLDFILYTDALKTKTQIGCAVIQNRATLILYSLPPLYPVLSANYNITMDSRLQRHTDNILADSSARETILLDPTPYVPTSPIDLLISFSSEFLPLSPSSE